MPIAAGHRQRGGMSTPASACRWGRSIEQGLERFVTRPGLCLLVVALFAGGCGGGDNASEPPATGTRRQAPDESSTSERMTRTDARPGGGRSRKDTAPAAPILIEPDKPDGARASKRSLERRRRMGQAKTLPQTRQAGCERAVFRLAGGRAIWGPPTPRIISAPRRGARVSISFAFNRLPTSPACRPYALTASVVSGKLDTPSFRLSDRRFRVVGPRGSATLPAPTGGRPPYTARVQAFTIDGRPSRQVKAQVK